MIRFSHRDKWLFEITEVEITRVDSMSPICEFFSFVHLCAKGRGAIRADFGPMPEINFVVVTI